MSFQAFRNLAHRLAPALLLAMLIGASGCAIAGFGGAMVESYRRSSTRAVESEYRELAGRNWAVVVAADRAIQGEFPDIVPYLTAKITERLVQQQDEVGAQGYVPADRVLLFQYQNPRWVAMPYSELARALKVDRLIFVELQEYRLNEPGNQYIWSGLATGTVGVVEADGPLPDEFSFSKTISVSFPDKAGVGQNDMSNPVVATALASRFVDRASWLFYTHQEPYYPKY
jgi:hypothetical protein